MPAEAIRINRRVLLQCSIGAPGLKQPFAQPQQNGALSAQPTSRRTKPPAQMLRRLSPAESRVATRGHARFPHTLGKGLAPPGGSAIPYGRLSPPLRHQSGALKAAARGPYAVVAGTKGISLECIFYPRITDPRPQRWHKPPQKPNGFVLPKWPTRTPSQTQCRKRVEEQGTNSHPYKHR